LGCFGLFITDSEEIPPKSGLTLKEVMLGSLNITRLLNSNVINYCTSIGGIKMYWDSLTATGAYVSVLVSVCVVYLCQRQGTCAPKQGEGG
jgi:hypothetical protein